MQRRIRIALVTVGLMVAGGIFGTITGMLVLLVWMAATEPSAITFASLQMMLFFSIFFGGGPGALLGPLGAWLLMRNVPLWLAVGGTTLGTFASGGLAVLITGQPMFALLVGPVGFMASAAALYDRFPDEKQRLTDG